MRGLLVGFGSIGRRHLTNFHAAGVHDWAVVRTGLGTLPLETPVPVRTHPTLAQALETERPDFAVIANPTSLHVESALACAEAGCPMVLEKPVSHSLAGLDALAATVARNGVPVLVAYQFRFHPALHRIRALLHDRTVGDPLHARIVWGEYLPGWHPWEDWRLSHASKPDLGGGVLHIAHPFDYLRMLLGDPVQVQATLSDAHPLGIDVPEAVDAHLRFAGDVAAQVHVDYWMRPQTHTVDITCSEGAISWNYITGDLGVWSTATGAWTVERLPGVEARNDLFVALAHHFLDMLERGAESLCSLDDGIREARIADAIERSSAQGGRAVLMPE